MSFRNRRVILSLMAFLWLVAMVMYYFVSHKPFSPPLVLSVLGAIWQILAAWAIVSLAGGLGRRLLSAPDLHPLSAVTIQAALGLGVFGIGLLILGATAGLHPILWGGILVVSLIALRRDVLGWWRGWHSLETMWRDSDKFGRGITIGTILVLSFTLVTALAPPLKFDTLVYHLTLPRMYIQTGRVIYIPEIMYWGMPQIGEMLYTWVMLLAGDQAATVLGWMFGLLALVGLLGYVVARLGTRAAWVSVASLLAGYTMAGGLAWGYVDWLAILFGWAVMVAFDAWQAQWEKPYLLLAGVFAGFALGVKYSAGVMVLVGLVSIVWHMRGRAKWPERLSLLFQFGLAASLVTMPWLIKNFLATGNPAYPFFYPAGAMDPLRLEIYQGGRAFGGWQDVVFLPLRATFMGQEGGPGYGASIGPLLLGLGVAAWLGWSAASERFKATVINAALIAVPGLLIWAVVGRFSSYLLQSRLHFAIFPALAVLAGAGFENFQGIRLAGVRFGRVISFLIAFVFALNVFKLGVNTLNMGPSRVVFGLSSGEDYLANNLGWYGPAMEVVRNLPNGTKVLMLWEARSLHCVPNCEPDEIIDRWLRERYAGRGEASPAGIEEILQSWEANGYTHILLHHLGADFVRGQDKPHYQPSDWQSLDDLLSRLKVVEEFVGAYTLYELSP